MKALSCLDYCFTECDLAIPSSAATIQDLKELDLAAFKEDIVQSELSHVPINMLPENYDRILPAVLDKHAPLQRKVLITRPNVRWFNDELKLLKTMRS